MLARWRPMSSKLECSHWVFSELLLLSGGPEASTETLVPGASEAIFSNALPALARVSYAGVNFGCNFSPANLTLTC